MDGQAMQVGFRVRRRLLVAALAALMCAGGCEVDSFLDPSKTGRFEFEPTTMPVLERIDTIEPLQDYWATATPASPEDLMPRDLVYYIYPGDVVTVQVFELTVPNVWDVRTRRVDTSGFFRIPEVGDVRAAGLTAQQFEDEIRRQLRDVRRMMVDPQVDVVVEQSGGLRYTVYGFVSRTGQYTLDNPNLRLVDALASAGGVPLTTERVYVIRQIVLSPGFQPEFERHDEARPDQPAPTAPPPPNIDELLRQLEEPPPAPPPAPEVRPGMIQDASPTADQSEKTPLEPPPPPPPVDVDVLGEMEPVRAPQQPPVDVEAVTPPTANDEVPIYDPQRGEWIRVPRAATNGAAPSNGAAAQPAAAQPPQVLDRIIEVDYERLSHGDSSQNVVIRPNDRIYVDGPPQGFFYIDGEVARVGPFQLPTSGKMTLSRAITTAGGFGPIAITSRVDITRRVGPNREATIRLDVGAIRQRTEPDVVIKPDDHIIVGTSFWATPLAILRNGFRVTYGFGFLLDRNFGPDVFGNQNNFNNF